MTKLQAVVLRSRAARELTKSFPVLGTYSPSDGEGGEYFL